MKKKFLIILSVIFMAISLCGCNSEISVSEYRDSLGSGIILSIKMASADISELNSSATSSNGTKHNGFLGDYTVGSVWTVEQYLLELAMARLNNFAFTVKTASQTAAGEQAVTYSFYTYTLNINKDTEEETTEKNYTETKNFYFYKVRYEIENPFNKYSEEYKNVSGTDYYTWSGIIENGWRDIRTLNKASEDYETAKNKLKSEGYILTEETTNNLETYYRELMPPLKEAFPVIKSSSKYNSDLLKTNYIINSSLKMNTSGEKIKMSDGTYRYVFSARFFESDNTIVYQYIYANTVGWNITAIIIGLLTVAGVFLYAKFRKPKKPKQKTIYNVPSDPFGRNDKPANPFDGY